MCSPHICADTEGQPQGNVLAAAGIVVTETNTPDRPPSLADVSDRAPAAPAMSATMKDHLSGA